MELNKKQTNKIIFLDVDGVLNCSSTKDRCMGYIGIEDKKVSYLKQIVDTTKASIVLVSTWKYYWHKEKEMKWKQDEMANYLDDKLSEVGLYIWDKTKEVQKRGKEIKNFIDELNARNIEVEKFVILDDEVLDYIEEGLSNNLVHTNYLIGLTINDSIKAINTLK